jgi:hypothetical protein
MTMAVIVTRPGEQIATDDPVLIQAYRDQDNEITVALGTIVAQLRALADSDHSVAVHGFDATSYHSLRRDARQAASELGRSLERWLSTVS